MLHIYLHCITLVLVSASYAPPPGVQSKLYLLYTFLATLQDLAGCNLIGCSHLHVQDMRFHFTIKPLFPTQTISNTTFVYNHIFVIRQLQVDLNSYQI